MVLAISVLGCEEFRARQDGSANGGAPTDGATNDDSGAFDASVSDHPAAEDSGATTNDAPDAVDASESEAVDVVDMAGSGSDRSNGEVGADVGLSCPSAPANLGLACGCSGKVLCDGSCSGPDDTCVPTGQWFYLTNMFLGDGRRLDTYSGNPADAFMSTGGDTAGQFWKVTALAGGYYRLTNMFFGDAQSLQAAIDGSKLTMAATAPVPAQSWKIRAAFPNYFVITNVLLGDTQRLDTKNNAAADPWMAPTSDVSGQYWKLSKPPSGDL